MGAKGVGECFLGSATGAVPGDGVKRLVPWRRTAVKEGGGGCNKESSKARKEI